LSLTQYKGFDMFIIKGKLLHLFVGADFTKEDGTVVPGKTKVQLLVLSPLKNGEVKNCQARS
jgi:hypothetical protein